MAAIYCELYKRDKRVRQLVTVDGDISRVYYNIGILMAIIEQCSSSVMADYKLSVTFRPDINVGYEHF